MPSSLDHMPNLPTKPLVGHTLDVLNDSYGLHRRSRAAFGAGLQDQAAGHMARVAGRCGCAGIHSGRYG